MEQKKSASAIFDLSAQALDYPLPDERIARYPLPQRDQSNLLVWQNGKITDSEFRSLAGFLPEKSLLVFNNTKVIRARLHFQKATGAHIEIFCLDPEDPADYQLAFQQTQSCTWNCMVGNLKKWKDEILVKELTVAGKTIHFKAEKTAQENGSVKVRFSWDEPATDFASLIEAAGILPIPPYLNRETEDSDLERYQTIYSKIKGSVAAPTAGLHFTDAVFKRLEEKQIDCDEVTLHVGAGTFRPVKSETIAEHEMHAEQIMVRRSLIEKILNHPGKLIAVGTTSIRTLESLYWLGVCLNEQPELHPEKLEVGQWQPYHSNTTLTKTEALESILAYMQKLKLQTIGASTKIIIVPGYRFRLVEGMITNFHQPQSTLLLLISAFVGNDWKRIYEHALAHDYRFLSYGDSNLYLKD
ncbi:S-adenosylmethionine:tRNA ribosyltransferase-isomerase [Gaoshiqia sediminis]|uniref:S-adenosylmethionine:tRNA ribosyltransferase-isomerase n=1 Tax=Gaoshiqia sediminis TaxID=2986998 RepID=A0AA41Y6X7_9BACT|nr:S-adenosylmethionine:tRNA ribosyltransferase-isomerase [Gaoshiqia sediminis]MCW0483069.1 S-adenosylmethionine:tRNA ribosyltransferase-isomerase [Gaoshiqia sediminis]